MYSTNYETNTHLHAWETGVCVQFLFFSDFSVALDTVDIGLSFGQFDFFFSELKLHVRPKFQSL